MKEGNIMCRIGDVFETCAGGTPLKSQKDYYEGGNIPWLRSGEVCKKYITETERFITQKGMENSSAKMYQMNTVVDAMYGATAAQVGILKIETTSNQAVCGILPNPNFIPEYVYYWFVNIKKELASQAQGGAQLNISQIKIKNILIPRLNLDEQRRIVSYLDSSFKLIDEIKEKAQKSLSEAKALFQSALAEAMEPKEGWEEKTLKEIGLTQTGTTPSKANKAYYGNYIPFIRPSEINIDGIGTIEYNSEIMLSQKGIEVGRKFTKNSILMVCIGATIGKVGYSGRDVSCNQQITVLSPYNGYNYKYIYYAMSSSEFQKKVIKEGTSAQATLPIINKGKWEKLSLYIPPLSTQKQIVSHLDKLSSNVKQPDEKYQKIVEECDALKQAMLRDVFE